MDERIVRAMRMIESGMADGIGFSLVADASDLSTSHFHQLFLEETGFTPGAYLRRIRLDAAALRLRWTTESVGKIALGLGYASQSAFSRAFVARFGVTPARFRREFDEGVDDTRSIGEFGPIAVREVDEFHLLAKRYVGDLYSVRDFWRDFAIRLPGDEGMWRKELFLGLLYDDPLMSASNEVRYDCCVTVGGGLTKDVNEMSARQLHRISTQPGLYGCVRFAGHRDSLAGTYHYLCNGWARNSRFSIGDGPAIELHAGPRHLMPPERLELTLMLPLEG